MASVVPFTVSPCNLLYSKLKLPFRVRVQSLGGRNSNGSSSSISEYDTSFIEDKVMIDGENRKPKSRSERNWVKNDISKDLKVLWDDGYGTNTMKDYLEASIEISVPDGGPPRWFCPVECGKPLKNSPPLLFLPGLDGVGWGLALQHKSIGKVFECQCLHIPIHDQTPFEGLVKLVEKTVRAEHATSPNRPIYILGNSFGGCIALAVAARNPHIDLVLILVNPATSFSRTQLHRVMPIYDVLPEGLCYAVLWLICILMGDPLKMAMADIEFRLPPRLKIEQLLANLIGFAKLSPVVINTIPKEILSVKVEVLNSGAAFANSNLHNVKAEVLLIVSGNDYILPSKDGAEHLRNSLQNCTVRYFKDNGHILLSEEGINLLTIIKATGKYRRSRRHDWVSDFIPPSKSESKFFFDRVVGPEMFSSCCAVFSTMANGKIVRGLNGVPDEGPVIYIGNHMLMGVEICSLFDEFMGQKNFPIYGAAHPIFFSGLLEKFWDKLSLSDWFRVMGAVPATPANLAKLFSAKKHVFLFPGDARGNNFKTGEEYKLKWLEEPEFVKIAARFGATIVPFGSVGEDDLIHLNLDYSVLTKIPLVNNLINVFNNKNARVRNEVASEKLYLPGFSQKTPPGRIYTLFGKPIETKGREELMKDKEYAKEIYFRVKSEVRRSIDYLLKKRGEDPYRNIVDRTFYRAFYSPLSDIPSFDP